MQSIRKTYTKYRRYSSENLRARRLLNFVRDSKATASFVLYLILKAESKKKKEEKTHFFSTSDFFFWMFTDQFLSVAMVDAHRTALKDAPSHI